MRTPVGQKPSDAVLQTKERVLDRLMRLSEFVVIPGSSPFLERKPAKF
jgi:hypothetical protein